MTMSTGMVRFHDVRSADGTRLRAWTNGAEGPDVLVSNGLGTNPWAWPSLLRPDCGVHAVSWNHRGVGGSARTERTDLDSMVEDAVAVLDDAGIDSCVVASWSTGVTVAFELAHRFPERVSGILAVAGVPGNTFGTMLAPWRVPALVARTTMVGLARLTTLTGYPLAPVTRRIPWTRSTTELLQQLRVIDRSADTAELQAMVQEFFTTHPAWYARLALGVAEHERVPLSGLSVPTTFIGGRKDLLSSSKAMATAAERLKGSRYLELDATHFITIEQPQIVLDELHALLERV